MGLGLDVVGRPRRRGTWPFRGAATGGLDEVSACARDYCAAAGLGAWHGQGREGDRLIVRLLPFEEPAEFWMREGGELDCSAKTSSLGPGYHQFLVHLLDRIGERLDLAWDWADDADESGYAQHRDFRRLQRAMAEFLRSLAGVVVARADEDLHGSMLSMPLGFGATGRRGVITQTGERPPAWFRNLAEAPDHELETAAAEYFCWWEAGLTAQTWRGLGLATLWMDVRWTPPTDPAEAQAIAVALAAFDRAASLDPRLRLPEREILELQALQESAADTAPRPDGIGYRRGLWSYDIAGGWTLKAPGWFHDRWDEERNATVIWNGAREIWATTFTLSPPRPPARADIEAELTPDSFMIEHDGLTGWVRAARADADDGTSCLRLHGEIHSEGGMAVLTILAPDESDLDWARGVFESVRFARPPG